MQAGPNTADPRGTGIVDPVLRSFLRALENLAVLDDPPHRTALALAIRVGLSFSPLLGLQIPFG